MRLSFLNKPYPVVTGIMAAETSQELINEAYNAEFDGAQGIAIELTQLKPEFRTREELGRIIASVALPFMFYYYRNDRWATPTDDERQEVLLAAADVGAAMIDVMGDLYDPSPREITYAPAAIDKQRRLIDKIHAKGADVVISSHMSEFRTLEQVLEHMTEIEKRGADVVKIVTAVNTDEELVEALRTTVALKRELRTPFIHLCNGRFSRIHRFMGPALGVSILFAVHRHDTLYAGYPPTIKAMRAVLDNLHWNINDIGSS